MSLLEIWIGYATFWKLVEKYWKSMISNTTAYIEQNKQ